MLYYTFTHTSSYGVISIGSGATKELAYERMTAETKEIITVENTKLTKQEFLQ